MLNKAKTIFQIGENFFRYKIGWPQPFFCVYFSTLECNYKCRYCPIAFNGNSTRSQKAQEVKQQDWLTTEQEKYAIDFMKKIGTVGISFTGGEPLLKENLEELALYAKKRHFFNVLNTNASLITEDRAYILAKCFDSVTVSLAGSPATDNMLRGDNAYEQTTKGIQILKKRTKIKVSLNFVINKDNYGEIDFIVDYAKRNCDSLTFLPICYHSDFFLDNGSAKTVQQKLVSLKKKHGNFISNSMEYINLFAYFLLGQKSHFNCDPFDIYYALAPNGQISGCCSYPYFVGNILSMTPKDYSALCNRHKNNLLAQCGGCSSPICWELSALYRRPALSNISFIGKYLNLVFNK